MDSKQLIFLGGVGAIIFYFITRPKLKLIDIDKLSQTITVEFKKLQYTYKTTDGMKEFKSGSGSVTFVTNGNVVDVYGIRGDGKLLDYKQFNI